MKWVILAIMFVLLVGCAQVESTKDIQNDTKDKNLNETPKKYRLKEEVDIPDNIRVAAEQYIKSRIGPDEKITLKRTTLRSFCSGSCNQHLATSTSTKKYCVKYFWNWSQHGIDRGREIDLGFDTNGTLYCARSDMLDCINHPETCPPFNITEEEAKNIFSKKCGQIYTHMGVVYVNNTPYWRFDNSRYVKCNSPPCPHSMGRATYYGFVDAQTGNTHVEGTEGASFGYSEC